MYTRSPGLSAACFSLAIAVGFLAPPKTSADVVVDVHSGINPVIPGELLDVEITVTNSGGSDLNDLTVQFAYPGGVNSLSESLIWGDCPSNTCDPGEVANFAIASLPAGNGRTLNLPLRLLDNLTDGEVIPLVVDVIDNGIVVGSSSKSVAVDAGRLVQLVVTETTSPVAPGAEAEIVVAFGVSPGSPGSPDAELRVPVPPGAEFESASHGGVVDGSDVLWDLGNIGPGASGQRIVHLTVLPDSNAGEVLPIQATFSDAAGGSVVFTSAVRIEEPSPLRLSITASPDPAMPGELLDLEIAVANAGPFSRTDVSVYLDIPDGLASIFDSLLSGDCPSNTCDPQERVTYSFGTLPPGEGRVVSLPLRVLSSAASGDVVTFEARAYDSGPLQTDTAASVVIDSTRTLELQLSESRDPTSPGESVSYELTWGVLPDDDGVADAALRIEAPADAVFTGISDGGTINGSFAEWSLSPINPGRSGTVSATAKTLEDANIGEVQRVRANFTGGGQEHRASTTGIIQNKNPLEVSAIIAQDPVRHGEVIDVEFAVTNTGVFDRTDVRLVVELPDEIASFFDSAVDGDCPSNTCDPQERMTFSLGTLAPGEGRTFFVPMQLAAGVPDGSTFVLECATTDAVGDRRTTTTAVAVDSGRDLWLACVEADDPVVSGEPLTLTLTYGSDIEGAGVGDGELRVSIPETTVVVDISGNGFLRDGSVVWPVGKMSPGQGGNRYVTIVPGKGSDERSILSTAAVFEDRTADFNEVRSQEATRVAESVSLDVEVTWDRLSSSPSDTTLVDLSISNLSVFERPNISLFVNIPDGVDSFFDSGIVGDCPSNTCDPTERAVFFIPVLLPGETVSYAVPLTIAAAVSSGSVINIDASATDLGSAGMLAADGDALSVTDEFSSAISTDLNQDGVVSILDLLEVIGDWGACPDPDSCHHDIDGNGIVGVNDLLAILAEWD